ncbi:16S rRNA (cytosine(1402)-N(4))-methyltransferase RsmH [Mycoplasmoides pirum]|uniref:16S rRNA (cytosine(1402)-N(4))-methyltransferase RsmH n=1 Tax=Mycoplasmoides pirum TaxID=2122 RepID=UPI000488C41B|nr:16S rRNA (cytosine(1402)-N(4))-methyltransferase RsmH [Mycoplasmoides pirum]
MNNNIHKPVLLDEVINYLNIQPNGIYCDFTIGYGGHTSQILKKLKEGKLIGFDQDPQAIDWCANHLNDNKIVLINDNFVNFKKHLNDLSIKKIQGALLDLGVSSLQFDLADRGFSYQNNGPLDMRMNQSKGLTAEEYIRKNNLQHLINVFKKYGEIKNPVHISKLIKEYVDHNKNVSTWEIENLIKQNLPIKLLHQKKHPARLYFQALRIAVNDELNVLKIFLNEIPKFIDINGILAIITFHSLEEKIVLKKINELCTPPILPGVPINNSELVEFNKVTKSPIKPSEIEIKNNHRSRSAKLFIIKRTKICTI